jgi:hypothetical protein
MARHRRTAERFLFLVSPTIKKTPADSPHVQESAHARFPCRHPQYGAAASRVRAGHRRPQRVSCQQKKWSLFHAKDIHKVEYEADEGKSRVRKNFVMGGDCG